MMMTMMMMTNLHVPGGGYDVKVQGFNHNVDTAMRKCHHQHNIIIVIVIVIITTKHGHRCNHHDQRIFTWGALGRDRSQRVPQQPDNHFENHDHDHNHDHHHSRLGGNYDMLIHDDDDWDDRPAAT